MSGGGSKKGERRGGRQKGAKNKPRIVAEFQAIVDRAKADVMANPDRKLAKDTLADLAAFFEGLASAHQPSKDASGRAVWRDGDKALFVEFATIAGRLAAQAAPYQSPTYKAIAVQVQQVPAPAQPRQLTGGNVIDLRDITATYRRVVCGGK